eukprot:12649600-Ditylum_brightwellii.AAC.1
MKKEVRKQGKPTQVDRPFKKPEFEQAMEILSSFPDFNCKHRYTTMDKFQFHLIARLDNTYQVKKDTLVPCFQFPFDLMVKLRWSKNVHNERDAPEQIVLRAMNAKYCILLALESFLEKNISFWDGQLGEYLFGSPDQKPESLNSNCCDGWKFGDPQLQKDDVDIRARWKQKKRQQDVYADVTLP